jgi:hypothetical protein
MDLSIIIVSWNAKGFLQECLGSIFAQGFSRPLEVIVVDNCSKDGSTDMVRADFPQVVLIENKKNYGFAKANNIGIKQSRGTHLALINSDVKLIEGCLYQMCAFMDQHPKIGISGPRILNSDHSLQDSCRKFPTLWNNFCEAVGLNKLFPKSDFFCGEHMIFFSHDVVRRVDGLVGAFWMVRRSALDQVGLLDERFFIYAEDIDWCRRFWNAGWEVVFCPSALAIHYIGRSSANDPVRFSTEQMKAKFQYWSKHHSRFHVLALSAIVLFHYGVRAACEALRFAVASRGKPGAAERMKMRLAAFNGACRFALEAFEPIQKP